MKLMIDIPKEVVTAIQNGQDYRYDIHTAIAQGKSYDPSGDLISREALKEAIEKAFETADLSEYEACICVSEIYDKEIDNAPTVEAKTTEDCIIAYGDGYETARRLYARPQGEWGKWIIAEVQCPNCFKYFEVDYYSAEELNKCPHCGADMRGKEE